MMNETVNPVLKFLRNNSKSSDLQVVGPTFDDLVEVINYVYRNRTDRGFSVSVISSSSVVSNILSVTDVKLYLSELISQGYIELYQADVDNFRLLISDSSALCLQLEPSFIFDLRGDESQVDDIIYYVKNELTDSKQPVETQIDFQSLRDLIEDEINLELRSDFVEIIDLVSSSAETNLTPSRHIAIIIVLLSGKHGVDFYSVREVCDRGSIASSATLSRIKNRLEDIGAIKTQKRNIDVGRPRQELLIEESYFSDGDQLEKILSAVDYFR